MRGAAVARRRSVPARLRLVRSAILAGAVLVWAVATGMTYGAQAQVGTVADRTAPARTAAYVANAYLADADRTVIHSFLSGAAQLGGPGQRYLDDIKSASQALGQLAEDHAGDAVASGRLQSLNAMLVTYMGLVEQADATHRLSVASGQANDLGLTYLWYASKLLHEPGSGMLAQIEELGDAAGEDLADQRASPALGPVVLAVFLAVTALLLALLIGAQVWLGRRFRRLVNPPLAVATVCLLLLAVWTTGATVHTNDRYAEAIDTALPQLTAIWQAGTLATDADGQVSLGVLLSAPCGSHGCASTVDSIVGGLVGTDLRYPDLGVLPTVEDVVKGATGTAQAVKDADPAAAKTRAMANDRRLADLGAELTERTQAAQRTFNDTIGAAGDTSRVRIAIPLLAAAIALMALLGFKPRLDEYGT